jgi:hypothetical protein
MELSLDLPFRAAELVSDLPVAGAEQSEQRDGPLLLIEHLKQLFATEVKVCAGKLPGNSIERESVETIQSALVKHPAPSPLGSRFKPCLLERFSHREGREQVPEVYSVERMAEIPLPNLLKEPGKCALDDVVGVSGPLRPAGQRPAGKSKQARKEPLPEFPRGDRVARLDLTKD